MVHLFRGRIIITTGCLLIPLPLLVTWAVISAKVLPPGLCIHFSGSSECVRCPVQELLISTDVLWCGNICFKCFNSLSRRLHLQVYFGSSSARKADIVHTMIPSFSISLWASSSDYCSQFPMKTSLFADWTYEQTESCFLETGFLAYLLELSQLGQQRPYCS